MKPYDDPIQMLEHYKPDVVGVGAIYGHTGDFVSAAIERGVTKIVSDKPIAATWEKLEQLRKLTRENNVTLLTEFDFHSRAEFRAAREIVRSGQVGDPVLITAQKSYRFNTRPQWYADRSLYTGTMLWVASHAIDAIRFVTERTVVRVIGRQGNISQPSYGSMEDHCMAMLELAGGGSAIVHADFLRPAKAPTHGDDRFRLAGIKGVVEVRDRKCIFIGSDGEKDMTDSVRPQPMHLELLEALEGKSRDLYSTQASLDTAALLLHARDAADGQKWVDCTSR
jgi:predicted dehydrogenase